ncbi:cation:proton antiporter subunit C [Ferrimonas pelagia]|uniref:Na+/H+ antiporter subunit C n=1 Tax=Ferrimonas pelagia TaxID=1177826 RepID=A0ABP9FIH1_9GAMM
MNLLAQYNYWVVIILMMLGFYIVISHGNLVKKLMGLGIFQTSVFILYISMGNVEGATAPILAEGYQSFSSPLPHVLILTAIVVGIATTAVGLALVMRIREAYGTVEEDEIQTIDNAASVTQAEVVPLEPHPVAEDEPKRKVGNKDS